MSLSGMSISLHLRCLRAVGFCRLSPKSSVRDRRMHRAYHVFVLTATLTFVLQQCIYAYQEKNNMDKLSRVMFLMLCHVTCVAKQLVFYVDAERIDKLIESLDDKLFFPTEETSRELLSNTAKSAARLLRCYAGCAVATCVLWIVFPIIYRLQGVAFEFPFWMGFDYQQPIVFVLVLLFSFYSTTLVGVANTTMDAFMATILYQCTVQMRILRINFENLPRIAKEYAKQSGKDYDSTLYEMFVKCIIHYKKITDCSKLLQDIFGVALLIQFGVGGWILCLAAYKIISLSILSIEFVSNTMFITCILVELFLYCYSGNELTVESDGVVRSIYSMEWTHTPLRFRRSLLILMERAQRPLRPAAYVIPLTLETYVKILKSAYSFYAVLRQTK